MNVPISVAVNETKNHIVSEINNSGLPLCVLESMLKSIYLEVSDLARKELEKDIEKMNKQEQEEKKDE